MVSTMHLCKVVLSDVSVYLRRGDVRMAEQQLQHPKVCTSDEQMSCKGMPEFVWRDLCLDADLASVTLDQLPECLPRHARTSRGHKDVRRFFFCPMRSFVVEPLSHRGARRGCQGHHAGLSAFAVRHDEPFGDGDLPQLQMHQFADSKTGSVHRLKHGKITNSSARIPLRRREQALDFLKRENHWQAQAYAGTGQRFCRIAVGFTFLSEIAKKTSDGAQESRL